MNPVTFHNLIRNILICYPDWVCASPWLSNSITVMLTLNFPVKGHLTFLLYVYLRFLTILNAFLIRS